MRIPVRATTLNVHYAAPGIVEGMDALLRRLGFRHGRIQGVVSGAPNRSHHWSDRVSVIRLSTGTLQTKTIGDSYQSVAAQIIRAMAPPFPLEIIRWIAMLAGPVTNQNTKSAGPMETSASLRTFLERQIIIQSVGFNQPIQALSFVRFGV